MSWADIDWGNAPSWAAFAAASIAATFAARAYRREERRDRLKTTLEIREQASKVGAWVEKNQGSDLVVRIMNTSDLPVTQARLRVHVTWEPCSAYRFHTVRHDGVRVGSGYEDFELGTLSPKHDQMFPVSLEAELALATARSATLELQFDDAQGVSWTRDNGRLESVKLGLQPEWLAEVLRWQVEKEPGPVSQFVRDYQRWVPYWFREVRRWMPDAVRGNRRPFPQMPRRQRSEPPRMLSLRERRIPDKRVDLTKPPLEPGDQGRPQEHE
ncbi:hypothetical protein [Kineococcus radiotolerans]|nr:hypothetical protein [Kineococcus radiotolerans]